MKKLLIEGGRKLKGKVSISGAKNSAVALLPAIILSNSPVRINGLPNISDIRILSEILEDIGGNTSLANNTITVDTAEMSFKAITDHKARKLRASYYFMGAMLGKFKEAQIGLPGGCHLGPRPIDQHVKGFEALGAKVTTSLDGVMHLKAEELRGADIYLDIQSVGATINIMLAAVKAKGKTIIRNAAQEPEIVDVATFLSSMGANIKGAGTDTIRIEGVEELHGHEHTVIPDRIEAGTYMIMATAIGEEVIVDNIIPEHLEPLIAKLKEMGADIEIQDNKAIITKSENLKSVNVKTLVHPGFPTDLQQPFTTLLTLAQGEGTVVDTIYSERFKQIHELCKMGADGTVNGNSATIKGPRQLRSANVTASDLRAGAALVIAGLIADGVTEISGVDHIERGYEDIIAKLNGLGAMAWYENEAEETEVADNFKRVVFPKTSSILKSMALAENQFLRS